MHSNIDKENFILNRKIEDSYQDVAVFDGALYYRDKGILYSYDRTNSLQFKNKLEKDVLKIIYDKNIYILYTNGKLVSIDRKTGKQKNIIDLEEGINHAEIRNERLICYHNKAVSDLDLNFKSKEKIDFKHRPVKYYSQANNKSTIFLDRDGSVIKSRYEIYNGESQSFYISSVDEVFLYNYDLGGNQQILLSSAYIYRIKDNKIVNKKLIKNPRSIDVKNERIAVIDYKTLNIYDKELKLLESIDLGFLADKVSIRDNSIVVLSKDKISSIENGNLINTDAKDMKDYYVDQYGAYAIFKDRVEKIKAY